MHKYWISALISVIVMLGINAQQPAVDLDEMYYQARDLVNQNHYKEARTKAYEILALNPRYIDAIVLAARTLAWDHNYDSARIENNKALDIDPKYLDAMSTAIDIEYWAGNYKQALYNALKANDAYPNNHDLMLKAVKIYIATGDEKSAIALLSEILKINPYDYEANKLMDQLRRFKNRFAIEHTFDFYNKPFTRRYHLTSLQYQHDDNWGSIVGKVNIGQLVTHQKPYLSNAGLQFETDAYINVMPKAYLYLNYGLSRSTFFPTLRIGLEPFQTLKNNLETSLGGRMLLFQNDSINTNVYILTGSVSKYLSQNWFSFRPYIVFTGNQTSFSAFLFYRHYAEKQLNYIGGALGTGISPDVESSKIGGSSQFLLKSYSIRFDYQHILTEHLLFKSLAGIRAEDYGNKKFRAAFNFTVYLAYMF